MIKRGHARARLPELVLLPWATAWLTQAIRLVCGEGRIPVSRAAEDRMPRRRLRAAFLTPSLRRAWSPEFRQVVVPRAPPGMRLDRSAAQAVFRRAVSSAADLGVHRPASELLARRWTPILTRPPAATKVGWVSDPTRSGQSRLGLRPDPVARVGWVSDPTRSGQSRLGLRPDPVGTESQPTKTPIHPL
jgi:hypothetical protein